MKKMLFVFIFVCLFLSLSHAGIEWKLKSTTEGRKKDENKYFTAHVYAQAGNLKYVFEEVSKADDFYLKNGYWLFKANEENIFIVNDEEKSYMELSLDSLLQLTGFIGQLVKIEIIDPTISSEKLGDEVVAGNNCRHFKLITDYTMKMKVAFIKKTVKVHEVKEIWSIPNMKEFNELNKTFLKKNYKTGISTLDDLIQKQMQTEGMTGFPLKTIVRNTQSSTKGKVMSDTTTTMEVIEIKYTNFPLSFFQIPGDYQKNELEKSQKGGFFK